MKWRSLVAAVWPSGRGSALVSINEVNIRRTRLVLGWVNVSGFKLQFPVRDIYLGMYHRHSGQLSLAIH